MTRLIDLAFNVNLSSGIPGMPKPTTADRFDEYANDLYTYVINNLEELLSISNNDGYHVGMAFNHIIERLSDAEQSEKSTNKLNLDTDAQRDYQNNIENKPEDNPETPKELSDRIRNKRGPRMLRNPIKESETKLKLFLHCSVVCLWRGIQMGTMQSIIATHTLIQLIDKYRLPFFEPQFLKLTGLSLGEIIDKSPDELKNLTDKIYKYTKYYLIQITRGEDAYKDADLTACKRGKKYMTAIYDEMCDSLRGYMEFGII